MTDFIRIECKNLSPAQIAEAVANLRRCGLEIIEVRKKTV
jgi:hypothetical protein